MREKRIKRNNENFKCTLISNLSFRMSKLERKKKDREKKGNEGRKGEEKRETI